MITHFQLGLYMPRTYDRWAEFYNWLPSIGLKAYMEFLSGRDARADVGL